MPTNNSLPAEVTRLRRALEQVQRGSRYAHGGSLENAALEVKDDTGTLRAVIGMQPDGTIGLVAVDGPPPGAPTVPLVTASLGGLRVVWDGALAAASTLPADFDHVAVHVSTTTGFTPSAATYVSTITKAGDGGMLPVIPLPYQAHYVVLVSVNSSGIAGAPSAEASATPIKVDGPDLQAGSVTAAAIQAGAVKADKLEAILELATRLVAGNPSAARVELNEDGLRVYNTAGTLVTRFDAADGSAVFTGSITGSTITGGLIQTATSGARVTLNEAGANKVLVYDDTGTAIGELSDRGLLLAGVSGAVAVLDPDAQYPNLRFTNAAQTNSAYVRAAEPTTGDANLEMTSGHFTGSGYDNLRWRLYLTRDASVIERLRDTTSTSDVVRVGGRLYLDGTLINVSFINTADTTQNTGLSVAPNLVYTGNGRLSVTAPASINSAIYAEVPTAHTGNLLRLFRDTDKFRVDKDGNTVIAGTLTAGNMAFGSVNITPSAAHTPTSALVNFSALTGTAFRGYATASTTVPGSRINATPTPGAGVTGVSLSSVTSTSALVWVNRENTTQTTVNWQVIGT